MKEPRPESFNLNLIRVLAYGSTVSTYVLIVIGGYVSATGSGLACPDWPLCQGQVIPSLEGAVLVEYTHRLFALVAGAFILSTALYALLKIGNEKKIVALSTASLILLAAQVILGMITVRTELDPVVTTGHLALASGVFALVLANAFTVRSLVGRTLTRVQFRPK